MCCTECDKPALTCEFRPKHVKLLTSKARPIQIQIQIIKSGINMSPLSNTIEHKKTLGLASETSIAHHIKGIRPALSVMEGLGFSAKECLKGTGISVSQLEQADQGISLRQELAFYRHLLSLTQDPHIGLKLGKAYRLENYGMLGFAILSAQTLGEALIIAKDFGPLSFSHFELDFELTKTEASIIMRQNKALEQELLALYEDRDCAAIIHGTRSALGKDFPLNGIDFMQASPDSMNVYADFFECPVNFQQEALRIRIPTSVLSIPMPLRDPETSSYCRDQCKQLLHKISKKRSVIDQVRAILESTETGFPTLKQVCLSLDIPERSLRRQLEQEGYKFQQLLTEKRFERAKRLLKSSMPLEEVAHILGYSDAGNFSHAFKRWSGLSPKEYRLNTL